MEFKFYCTLHKSTSLDAVGHTHTHTHTHTHIYQVIGFIGGAAKICDMVPLPWLICFDISTQSKMTIKNVSSWNFSTTAKETIMQPRTFGPKSPSAIYKYGELTLSHSTPTNLSSVKSIFIFFTC